MGICREGMQGTGTLAPILSGFLIKDKQRTCFNGGDVLLGTKKKDKF